MSLTLPGKNVEVLPPHQMFPIVRGWDEVSDLYTLIAGRGYIAGGFASWMGSPLDNPPPPSDIDIFAVSDQAGWELTQDICAARGWVWDISPIAWTLKPDPVALALTGQEDTRRTVQVVRPDPKWFERRIEAGLNVDPGERWFAYTIIDSFDFDVCRGVLMSPESILGDPNMGQWQATIKVVRNPVMALRRVLKYMRKGVRFSDQELFKLFCAFERLNRYQKGQMYDAYGSTSGRHIMHTFRTDFDDRWFSQYVWVDPVSETDVDFNRFNHEASIVIPDTGDQDIPF